MFRFPISGLKERQTTRKFKKGDNKRDKLQPTNGGKNQKPKSFFTIQLQFRHSMQSVLSTVLTVLHLPVSERAEGQRTSTAKTG